MALGLPLRSEFWGLNDGMRLYGALDFDPIARLRKPEGTGPSPGIRHAPPFSMTRRASRSSSRRARVILCDNGVTVGEIARVHADRVDTRFVAG